MLQIVTILFALGACLLAIMSYPVWGWLLIGVVNLYFSLALRACKQRYRFVHVQELSLAANAMLQQYGHYFAMPFGSRDASASAATNQFAGIGLGVINVINGFWPGIVLSVVNWVWMSYVACSLTPTASMVHSPEAKMAHDEVLSFFRSTSRSV